MNNNTKFTIIVTKKIENKLKTKKKKLQKCYQMIEKNLKRQK